MNKTREDILLDKVSELLVENKALRVKNARIGEDYLTLAGIISDHVRAGERLLGTAPVVTGEPVTPPAGTPVATAFREEPTA